MFKNMHISIWIDISIQNTFTIPMQKFLMHVMLGNCIVLGIFQLTFFGLLVLYYTIFWYVFCDIIQANTNNLFVEGNQ